jgi:hypothetical protein
MRGHFIYILSQTVEIEREITPEGSDRESEDSAEALPESVHGSS